MTLTGQAGDPRSPLSRYLAAALPNLAAMTGPLARALGGASTIRPGGDAPRQLRDYWPLAGAAIDYRLRLALTPDPGEAVAAGASGLAFHLQPRMWPVLTGGAFETGVAGLLDELHPAGLATPLPLPDPAGEQRLCRLAWWFAVFDQVYRSGKPPDVHSGARRDFDALLAAVPQPAVEDLTRLATAAGAGPFAALRTWSAGKPIVAGPRFAGSDDVGNADADLIAGGMLVDIKTTIHPSAMTGPGVQPWHRQLVGYLLLDYPDTYRIRHLSLYLARQAVAVSWPVQKLLTICAGDQQPRALAEHRTALQRHLHRGSR